MHLIGECSLVLRPLPTLCYCILQVIEYWRQRRSENEAMGVHVVLFSPDSEDDKLNRCSSLLITLRDGGLWTGRVGSAECQRPPITMATSVLSQQEVLRQLHLRRHIDELKRNVEEREQAVHKNR